MCGKQQAYHTDAQSAASAHNQSAKTLDCRVEAFFQKYQSPNTYALLRTVRVWTSHEQVMRAVHAWCTHKNHTTIVQ